MDRWLSIFGLMIAGFMVMDCGLFQKGSHDGNDFGGNVDEIKEGEATSIAIESGAAAGTTVTVPPGALAAGTIISVSEAPPPVAFTAVADVEAGSVPIVVEARSADDQPVVDLSAPMTLAIPISGSTQLADTNLDNLCAFLETPARELYLWRRTSISVNKEGTLASLTTVKLGVFQLVFCGTETLDNFQDVEETGISTGDTAPLLAQLTIPASRFDWGQQAVCAGVVGIDLDDMDDGPAFDDVFMAFGGGAWESKDLILRMPYREGLTEANLDYEHYLISLVFSDEACPDQPDPDASRLRSVPLPHYSINFIVAKEDIVSGAARAMAGEDPFGLRDITIKLGTPEQEMAWPGEDIPEACLVINYSFSGAYTFSLRDGNIISPGGNAPFVMSTTDIEAFSGEGEKVILLAGRPCKGISFDDDEKSADWDVDLYIKADNTAGVLYAVPKKLRVSTKVWDTEAASGTTIELTGETKVCIEVYKKSDLTIEGTSFSRKDDAETIFRIEDIAALAEGVEKDYIVLIPYENEPYYLKPRLMGDKCDGDPQYVFERSATEDFWPAPVNPR